jgi:hypothetical protein
MRLREIPSARVVTWRGSARRQPTLTPASGFDGTNVVMDGTCSREVTPHEHHVERGTSFPTQARASAFSVTNRLRERKAAGLSNSRTARSAARDDANQGR